MGDESRRLTLAQQRELGFDRSTSCFDISPVDAPASDLDESLCVAYQRKIDSSSIADMLRARDLLTRDGRVTVAAWLLFGPAADALPPAPTFVC